MFCGMVWASGRVGWRRAPPNMIGGVPAGQSDRSGWIRMPEPYFAMSLRTRSSARWALALAMLVAACDDANPLDPSLVTTTELSDLFTFSVVGLSNVADAKRYLWVMTGDQATVDVTSALPQGSAFLQIRGADGTIVYADDIESEEDGVTAVNAAGIWQVDVVIDKASGSFEFALERDTVP